MHRGAVLGERWNSDSLEPSFHRGWLADPLGQGSARLQRTNTVTVGRSVATGFSRWSFRCLGAHLLRSPSDVKSGKFALAALLAIAGDTPSVANNHSPPPNLVLRRMTSSRCRVVLVHSSVLFRFNIFRDQRFMVKTKTPLPFR